MISKITPETCAYKVQALRSSYVKEELIKCINCSEENQFKCEDYIPMSRTQQPVRKGLVAFMSLRRVGWWKKNLI